MLFLRKFLVGVCFLFFVRRNFLLFYFIFELVLFPTVVIIFFYGSQVEKISAAYYLLFYTSFCAFPLFYVLLVGGMEIGSQLSIVRREVGVMTSLAFLSKLPVFIFHVWLPKAHVEAPTSASIFLASLLLKLGGFGFYRFMGFFCSTHIGFWVLLGYSGCFLAPFFVALQRDLKRLAAYSSVLHINFVFISLLSESSQSLGLGFSLFLLHGFLSTILFFLIGNFYHFFGTRLVFYFSGLFSLGLIFGVVWGAIVLGNSGVPPFMTFFPELGGIIGVFGKWSLAGIVLFVYLFFSFYYGVFLLCQSCQGHPSFIGRSGEVGVTISILFLFWTSNPQLLLLLL